MNNVWLRVHEMRKFLGRTTTDGAVVDVFVYYESGRWLPDAGLVLLGPDLWAKFVTDPSRLHFLD